MYTSQKCHSLPDRADQPGMPHSDNKSVDYKGNVVFPALVCLVVAVWHSRLKFLPSFNQPTMTSHLARRRKKLIQKRASEMCHNILTCQLSFDTKPSTT